MTTKAQQIALDNALVAPENQHGVDKSNVLVIYMHQFWATVNKHNASYRFKIDNKRFSMNVKAFREILNICPKIPSQEFDKPPSEEETLSFIRELGHSREIKYITDVSVDHLHQPWRAFATIINKCLSVKAIIHHFLIKDKSISMRNRTFMHTAWDDSLLGTMRFISRHEDTQVYGSLLPKAITNQAMLDSTSYKTYYTIATGAEPLKPKKTQKKSDSAISSEETPSKKKPAKAKKDVHLTKKPTTKPKPTKKKAPIKADRGKGDGTDFESGVPGVPKYDSESKKESWGDNGEEEDDDEDDTEDESDNDGNDDDGGNDDNDDDSDDKRTKSDKDKNPNLNLSNEEHEEKEEEYANERVHTPKNHKLTDEEDNAKKENEEEKDDAEELYRDVNVNLRKEDVEMTDADQDRTDQYNVSQVSRFEQVEEDAHVTL
ncbi:hypothetical protein Tco_0577490, partial [Tanacetum coccineum]